MNLKVVSLFGMSASKMKSRSDGNRSSLDNLLPPRSSPLGNLVLLVIVWPTFPPWSTLNVNLESLLIVIMSKGVELKCNIVSELYFISSRNACDPRPLDVSSASKLVSFTRELEASSSRSKFFDLGCSTTFSWANHVVKLICPRDLPLTPEPTLRKSPCF